MLSRRLSMHVSVSFAAEVVETAGTFLFPLRRSAPRRPCWSRPLLVFPRRWLHIRLHSSHRLSRWSEGYLQQKTKSHCVQESVPVCRASTRTRGAAKNCGPVSELRLGTKPPIAPTPQVPARAIRAPSAAILASQHQASNCSQAPASLTCLEAMWRRHRSQG